MKKEQTIKYLNLINNIKANWGLTLVDINGNIGKTILYKIDNIKYENIYQAYSKPSYDKIKSAEDCVELVEDVKKEFNGLVIIKGIQARNTWMYNYLAKIYCPDYNMNVYIYCTSSYNYIAIEELN